MVRLGTDNQVMPEKEYALSGGAMQILHEAVSRMRLNCKFCKGKMKYQTEKWRKRCVPCFNHQ